MNVARIDSQLSRIEHHFRKSLHEYAHILTLDGDEETRLKGSKDKVPVPWSIPAFDRILTHNHPGGNPELSDKDCHLILCRGLRTIRSYTYSKGGWSLSVPEGVTPTERKDLDVKTIKALWGKKAFKKHGITGPALVAKLYNLELKFIQPMEPE